MAARKAAADARATACRTTRICACAEAGALHAEVAESSDGQPSAAAAGDSVRTDEARDARSRASAASAAAVAAVAAASAAEAPPPTRALARR